ncbi:hypothetical protein Tco_0582275, partial [Tanacetum coccineum]
FGMIPVTIPDTTPAVDSPFIPNDTPLIPITSPTAPIIPPTSTTQYISSFMCNDSSDSDTSDTPPPSLTYDTPSVEIVPSDRQVIPLHSGATR